MTRIRDCVFPVKDAAPGSPLHSLSQIAQLIALQAERYNLHYGAQMVSAQLNLAPIYWNNLWHSELQKPKVSFSHIDWRNL